MSKVVLNDAVELAAAERLTRFETAVSSLLVQDWSISSSAPLPPERTWLDVDAAGPLAISRSYSAPKGRA